MVVYWKCFIAASLKRRNAPGPSWALQKGFSIDRVWRLPGGNKGYFYLSGYL